ncbi:MAG: lysophospholipid acyltransferase family protein [Thalassobaculaceae bacterium]|nr:lysophospholipid acyltransferase family protein [Thalassobaculaceae bacterium]
MLKSILRSDAGAAVLTWILRGYLRLLLATLRLERRVDPAAAALIDSGKPFLGAFWHNRLGLIATAWARGRPMGMVHSSHGDGRMLGAALSDFISRPIEGSTRRNPMGALRGMLRALEDGVPVALTPDGPRGPRMRCQMGVVEAARRSGVAIIPVACSSRPRIQAGSWDRFLIPLPFTRGVVVIGTPIAVTGEVEDREPFRQQIEAALNAVTDAADSALGLPPIPPAPPRAGGSR